MAVSPTTLETAIPADPPHEWARGLLRRVVPFAAAVFLICLAQSIIADYDAIVVQQPAAPSLNDLFRFDLANPENAITGVLLLIAAGILILFALEPTTLRAEAVPEAAHPNRLGFARRHALPLIGGLVALAALLIQLSRANPGAALVLLWLVALALLVWVAYRYDHEAGTPLSLGLTRWDVLWLAALLIGGLLIGSYQLDSIPNSLVRDEGTFWERAYSDSQGQETLSFFDVGPYSYPLPGSLYQGAALAVFGITLWSWRFSSVLASVLTVIPLYLLARDIFDRRTALISGVALITLPYFLAFARLGYNNSQPIVLVTLMTYFLYLGIQRESLFYYALGGVFAGLGWYTYTAGRVGVVFGALFLVCMIGFRWLARRRNRSIKLRGLLIGSAVFVILSLATLLPEWVYTNAVAPDLARYKTLESLFFNANYAGAFFPPEELYRDYPPIVIGDQTFFFRPDLYARLLVRGFVRSLLVFHDEALTGAEYLAAPLAGGVSVLFYFVGLMVALRNLRRWQFSLILFWWFGSIFFLSIIDTFPARFQHFTPVIPTIALLIALGVTTAAGFIARLVSVPPLRRIKLGTVVSLVAALAICGGIVYTNLHNYFVEMPQVYLPEFEDVMAFTALHLDQPTNLIYVYDDPSRSDWIPWLINYIPTQAKYRAVSDHALNQFTLQPMQPYIFYFAPSDQQVVTAYLRGALGIDPGEPTAYKDVEGRVLGMSYRFTASDANG